MPALADEGAYQHLDIPTGYQVKQILVGTVRDLLEDAKKIGDSLLAPWQKLDAVSTFLLPRFDFIMQGATMEKEYLTAVYKTIRRLAMEWLYLPQRASAELVYLPPSQGGGGLLPLVDLHDVLTVAHSYRLLNSREPAVRLLTQALLKTTSRVTSLVTRACHRRMPERPSRPERHHQPQKENLIALAVAH
ncbi:unnamed protein product [Arctia plantaginis]|uniref:Uncharacterized protein n=1 Tax=Arctia plantaginis TaxID=874455 RepID=A0A8S0ZM88_ARCPL|nr:unnamed protein product [Arctia plantaginis]